MHIRLDRTVAKIDGGIGDDDRSDGDLHGGVGGCVRDYSVLRSPAGVCLGVFRLIGGARVTSSAARLEHVEQIDRVIGFDDQPGIGMVQDDFMHRHERRIQVGLDAVEAERVPFHQVFAQHAVHGVEIFQARVAVEGDHRQLVDLRAQPHGAVKIHLAAENEQIQFGCEIGVERGEVELVEVQFDVGGGRLEPDVGGDVDGGVGVPAQREVRFEVGAGQVGKIFRVQRDVAQIQPGRARIGVVLEMQRAIGGGDAAHRAGPLIRAVEQHGHGVGHGAKQEQDAARRIGGRLRRLGKFHHVDRGVGVAVQKRLGAVHPHGIYRGGVALQIHARAGDGKQRQLDDVVAVARLAEFEVPQGIGQVVHGRHAVGGVEFQPVFQVQRDGAVADLETHEVLVQRRVFVQREIEQLELAFRAQRGEGKKAAPGNGFAGVRGAGERVGIFVARVGAKIVQRDVKRADQRA